MHVKLLGYRHEFRSQIIPSADMLIFNITQIVITMLCYLQKHKVHKPDFRSKQIFYS